MTYSTHSTESSTALPLRNPGRVWTVLFLAVMALAIGLRLGHPVVSNPTPDEKTYQYYATRILQNPFEAPRLLVAEYNSQPGRWFYPPPTRIGYNSLLAVAMKCSGLPTSRAGVAVSVASSILQLFLIALIGLRFFDRWTTLFALALFSACPMDLAIAGRVWQDGVVGCAALILFYLCMEASLRTRKGIWLAAFWLFGAFFLFLKESAGPVFGLYCVWLTIACRPGKTSWKQCAGVVAGCLLTALFSFVVAALLSGGVPAFLAAIRHCKETMPLNQYAIDFQNGPWYSFPIGWWVLAPIPASLCVACVLAWLAQGETFHYAVAQDHEKRQVFLAMVALSFVMTVLATVPNNLMNLRYVSFIYGPCYLLAGLGLNYLMVACGIGRPAWAGHCVKATAAAVILAAMMTDYHTFHRIFVKAKLDDLAIIRVIDQAFK